MAYQFDFGEYRVSVVNDDELIWPIEEVIAPNADRDEIRAAASELGISDLGSVPLSINHLLVTTPDGSVLIDGGLGERPWPGGDEGHLKENLAGLGVRPPDIYAIVLTHSDYDHIGGIVTKEGEREFPEAQYFLSSNSWALWSSDQGRERISELHSWSEDRIQYVWDTYLAIEDDLTAVDYGDEFLAGFEFLPAEGHRYDNDVVKIESESDVLYDLGDAIIHPLAIRSRDWHFTYDVEPELAIKTKQRLLGLCHSDNSLVFATHFPTPGVGRVVPRDGEWGWQPVK